jgi:rhodanese-related sulfurtransferase
MLARLMGLPTLDPPTLNRRLAASERLAVFDVNSRHSWLEARIPGALHLDPQTFTQGELPAELDHPLVFYCSNPFCRKAPLAARRARKMGYSEVKVLAAGITGWLAAGLPSESGG